MHNYLEELEIINFVKKDNIGVKTAEIDLLIITESPLSAKFELLLQKIIQSLDKIDNKLTKEITCLDKLSNLDNKIYKKFLIFGKLSDQYVKELSNRYDLNNSNLLSAESIEDIANDIELKKKLWHNLQNFLAR